MDIVFLVIGIIAGLVIGYLFSQAAGRKQLMAAVDQHAAAQSVAQDKLAAMQAEKRGAEERASLLGNNAAGLTADLTFEREKRSSLQTELAALKSDYANLEEKLTEQKKSLEDTQRKLTVEFENLANKIFDEKGKKFADQNQVNLTEILKPLNEKIKDFQKKVEDTHLDQTKQQTSLETMMRALAESSAKISKEANDLTNALKGSSKTRGDWGEMILERILEKSGLVKDREYEIQSSFSDEQGKRLRPDIVVRYPGDKAIVIDSKVSLIAYERFSAAEQSDEQARALAEHQAAIRKHIAELSAKSYQSLYQLKTVDFVMMFVPIEPAYLVAIQSDPELWNFAYAKKVLLISPTNLIAALQMIRSLWQLEYQGQNAIEIARQAGNMYDKFNGFVEDLLKVGKSLESSQETYREAMKKLYQGKGNLVTSSEKLKELGAKASKSLPQKLVERAGE